MGLLHPLISVLLMTTSTCVVILRILRLVVANEPSVSTRSHGRTPWAHNDSHPCGRESRTLWFRSNVSTCNLAERTVLFTGAGVTFWCTALAVVQIPDSLLRCFSDVLAWSDSGVFQAAHRAIRWAGPKQSHERATGLSPGVLLTL